MLLEGYSNRTRTESTTTAAEIELSILNTTNESGDLLNTTNDLFSRHILS